MPHGPASACATCCAAPEPRELSLSPAAEALQEADARCEDALAGLGPRRLASRLHVLEVHRRLQLAQVVHPLRDVHVTLLNLLGLDDNRLTYFHAGRFKQLSQVGGQVIKDLLA